MKEVVLQLPHLHWVQCVVALHNLGIRGVARRHVEAIRPLHSHVGSEEDGLAARCWGLRALESPELGRHLAHCLANDAEATRLALPSESLRCVGPLHPPCGVGRPVDVLVDLEEAVHLGLVQQVGPLYGLQGVTQACCHLLMGAVQGHAEELPKAPIAVRSDAAREHLTLRSSEVLHDHRSIRLNARLCEDDAQQPIDVVRSHRYGKLHRRKHDEAHCASVGVPPHRQGQELALAEAEAEDAEGHAGQAAEHKPATDPRKLLPLGLPPEHKRVEQFAPREDQAEHRRGVAKCAVHALQDRSCALDEAHSLL
mmetsp:Transcript_89790/g.200681  ORF Transcript_89790/g.200681 Transcript_89790/m.200681 type:complete len:311 (-) Transcript_89790:631-1563(-)